MPTYATRDGTPWTPSYLLAIDGGRCFGCGRCYKVTPFYAEGGGQIADTGELVRKIMVLDNQGACIDCGACARVCPKACQTHGTI